tara:strand:+ start:106 stop:852 length:747 start_codon:yes stop_codon:yes gene_type:complete
MTNARKLADAIDSTGLKGNAAGTTDLNASALASGTLPDARFPATLPAISGANLTNLSIVKPTISSISPTVITNDATNVTINGSNYVSVPIVEAINSTGVITSANSITFTSASQLVANFTLATDGTYFIRIENNDGNAVRSGSAILTVSDVPAWTTAAGSLGNVDAAGSISFTVAATDATSYAVTSGSMPGGASLNASTGAITGTESGSTATTTYNFTITATDAQGQTAARAFSITVNHGISNSVRMDP